MRFLMDLCSGLSYFINQGISKRKYKGMKIFDFEEPLDASYLDCSYPGAFPLHSL